MSENHYDRTEERLGKLRKVLDRTLMEQPQSAELVPISEAVKADTTRSVLLVYKICLCFACSIIAYEAYLGGIEGAIDHFFEIFKIGVLPVITFVLGHYYGSATKRD